MTTPTTTPVAASFAIPTRRRPTIPAQARREHDGEGDLESLARRAATADGGTEQDELRSRTVLAALPMARAAARHYGLADSLEDLQQVAALALVKAVHGYRPGPETRFIAYARPTIHGELKRHVRDHGWHIRPPRHLQELRLAVRSVRPGLVQQLHREPTVEELAVRLAAAPDDVREAEMAAEGLILPSLDEERLSRYDVAVGGSESDRFVTWDVVHEFLSTRTDRERRIVALYVFDDISQSRIGAEYGMTQMQVSRLIHAVLRQLRVELGPR